jgi:hypothetical protein
MIHSVFALQDYFFSFSSFKIVFPLFDFHKESGRVILSLNFSIRLLERNDFFFSKDSFY